MTLKLGDLLLKEGLITPAQLEEALKYQVIFGGKLGTNLIEMDVLAEEDVSRALGRKFGVSVADNEELGKVPAEVIQLLPSDIAARHRLVPLRLEGRRLTVAMADPSDLRAIDEISFRTGLIIRPQVAAEVRIVLALEQHYGIERERRYIHAAKKIEIRKKPAADRETRPAQPPPAEVRTGAPHFSAMSATEDLGGTATPATFSAADDIEESEELVELDETPSHDEEFESEEDAAAGEAPGDAALAERLVEAEDRDDILDAVAERLVADFPRSALFLVRGEMAMGWSCARGGHRKPAFDRTQIPLDEPSVLRTVAETKSFYLGPIPRTPFNSLLLQEMGGTVPDTALLVPLLMMGRVVGILYVDGRGVNLGERLFDLQKLTAKAAMAFEILVLKNKILTL